MDFSSINWLAVLVCVVANMAIGFVWYNPKTFFPAWWKGIGKAEGEVPGSDGMGMTWALTVVSALVQAVFLSLLIAAMGAASGGASLGSGITAGFMAWLGFVAPTNLVNKLFAGHGLKVWAIEAGNHLANFLAMGAILGAWR